MVRPELLLDGHAIVAESLLREPRGGTLFWCDTKAPALFRFEPGVRGVPRPTEVS